ncbi:MAG: DUF4062 domain-containing protein [Bryobacterales bacterium]|nr:DUF4062 domain-containing protein [Bryobacterales bacterium]
MEYFGSKPGAPVDECLAVVKTCQVYIGIFGMRYGSVPDGYELSMTHLEYEEAQRNKLPSLIYIIDENAQPILPKYVETGPRAESLRRLKELLKKRHLISAFTTPDDLSAKILHDTPTVLTKIGAVVEGTLPGTGTTDSLDILRQFDLLPKVMRGREVIVDFMIDKFWSVDPNECDALHLESGATIRDRVKLSNGEWTYVYASNELAKRLINIQKGSLASVQGVMVFGVGEDTEWTDNGTVIRKVEHGGIHVKAILKVVPPEAETDS